MNFNHKTSYDESYYNWSHVESVTVLTNICSLISISLDLAKLICPLGLDIPQRTCQFLSLSQTFLFFVQL